MRVTISSCRVHLLSSPFSWGENAADLKNAAARLKANLPQSRVPTIIYSPSLLVFLDFRDDLLRLSFVSFLSSLPVKRLLRQRESKQSVFFTGRECYTRIRRQCVWRTPGESTVTPWKAIVTAQLRIFSPGWKLSLSDQFNSENELNYFAREKLPCQTKVR